MGYQLKIEPAGIEVEVAEGQTILDACLRAGVWLPHACCHGLCATCKIQVREGDFEQGEASPFALMDFEREEGKALACCAMPQSDLLIEAEIDEDPDARVLPVRDFEAQVTAIEALTPTIIGLHLRLDEALDFQAGQYINLSIPLPSGTVTRAFSLANSPSTGLDIELNIRRVPGGSGTGWLHEQLQLGQRLRLAGPYGRFFVRKRAQRPLIFMAGGSGLSSPRSMILDLLDDARAGAPLPEITLIYGQRTRAELYYHQAFVDLAAQYPQFHYVPALSQPDDDADWGGFRGFVHEAAKAHFDNDFRGHQAYLCGPPAMIDACISTLMQGRLFERDIFLEKFISAADAQAVRSPLFRRV